MRRGVVCPDLPELLYKVVSMPGPVLCDVCGKLFSSRHLSSHKRLAHSKPKAGATGQQDPTRAILDLYKALSAADKARVLAQLAALGQEPS
jgi:predicted amidophosphoribosyltransferase